MRLIEVHTDNVRCVAYSPDGRTLATGSNDRTVQLLDVATGAVKATLHDFTSPVISVAFSHDGALLAAGDRTPRVRVWQTANLDAPPCLLSLAPSAMRYRNRIGEVSCVAFSPVARVLFIGCGNRRLVCNHADVAVWDFAGEEAEKLTGHSVTGGIWSAAFVPDGTGFLIGTGIGGVQRFDPPKWKAVDNHYQGPGVKALAVSPDGKTIATAAGHGVVLWDMATRDRVRDLNGHGGNVNSLAYHPNGALLASASWDKTVRLWEASSGRQRAVLEFDVGKAQAVAFAPDGMTATLAGDGGLVLWDVDT